MGSEGIRGWAPGLSVWLTGVGENYGGAKRRNPSQERPALGITDFDSVINPRIETGQTPSVTRTPDLGRRIADQPTKWAER